MRWKPSGCGRKAAGNGGRLLECGMYHNIVIRDMKMKIDYLCLPAFYLYKDLILLPSPNIPQVN
jgi:hypothetical protein